jgi:TolB-like protein/Flp pilus assembly protein TadD
VTREDFHKLLWPVDTNVDFERGLNRAVNRLREALGDEAENPRFIETLPQRGYRFLPDVLTAAPLPALPEAAEIATPRSPMKRRGWFVLAGGAIAAPIAAVGYRLFRSTSPRIESIAVLPLENLSGNPEQEYFSDGLTDELIGRIARIGSLRVISRTSVMQYKRGARKSLPEIAKELNVDAILEGTVTQSGQKVRITAQLIRAQDDQHIWSEKYERELTDILVLQGEVASAVAAQIQRKLAPPQSSPRTRQVNPEAYQAFLKGTFFANQGIRGVTRSGEFFEQAIRIDPLHAESYVGLAIAKCLAGIYGFRPSQETYPEARALALKALAIDESSAGAHTVLADVKQGYDWDLAGAEVEFQRALELNPSYLMARIMYAESLTRMHRFDDAVAASAQVISLAPVAPESFNVRAMIFFDTRRFQEAIQASEQALEMDPSFVNALWWQGMSHAGLGDFPKSIVCLTRALAISDGALFRALLGWIYGRAGEQAKALAMLDQVTAISKLRYVTPVDFAIIYAGLGDVDSAFAWLEKAHETRAVRVVELRVLYFDGLRSDVRYRDLTRRVGLPI